MQADYTVGSGCRLLGPGCTSDAPDFLFCHKSIPESLPTEAPRAFLGNVRVCARAGSVGQEPGLWACSQQGCGPWCGGMSALAWGGGGGGFCLDQGPGFGNASPLGQLEQRGCVCSYTLHCVEGRQISLCCFAPVQASAAENPHHHLERRGDSLREGCS